MLTVEPVTAQIRLWQLISPSLPVGMFAWSQGLEYAVDARWLRDEEQVRQWLEAQLVHNIGCLDAPLLLRFASAWQSGDDAALESWSQFLYAAREASELNTEDRQLGHALGRVLVELEVDRAEAWLEYELASYLLFYSLAVTHWQIPLQQALAAYLWSWAENQVMAAIKLVPLGHMAGQRMLSCLLETIRSVAADAGQIADAEMGMSWPAFGIACARHETQYSRLFRS